MRPQCITKPPEGAHGNCHGLVRLVCVVTVFESIVAQKLVYFVDYKLSLFCIIVECYDPIEIIEQLSTFYTQKCTYSNMKMNTMKWILRKSLCLGSSNFSLFQYLSNACNDEVKKVIAFKYGYLDVSKINCKNCVEIASYII